MILFVVQLMKLVDPLLLEPGREQEVDPNFRFRISQEGKYFFREKYFDQDSEFGRLLKWEDAYVPLDSFESARQWIESGSLFAFDMICNLMHPNGRRVLTGRSFFVEETGKGRIIDEEVADSTRMRQVLFEEFGIVLDEENALKPASELTPFGASVHRIIHPN